MIKSMMGKKIGMTQVFTEEGTVVPVTVVEAGPVTVTRLRTPEKEGYTAVQLGFGEPKHQTKPVAGQFAKVGVSPKRYLREVKGDTLDLEIGQEIKVDLFKSGDKISVTGTSKGKGFAGVVKRYHFRGGPQTHGSMVHRKPQSGGATDAARTFKGVRRPGRMGGERVTVRGLTVVRVDPEKNLMLIKGAVPGANGGLLTISIMD